MSTPENNFNGMYFSMPPVSRKFHIFQNKQSLCGKVLYGGAEAPENAVKGTETYGSDDCKACFRKAGLKIE